MQNKFALDMPTAFGAPPTSFGVPAATFGAPPTSFGAPPSSFGAPPISFGTTPKRLGGLSQQSLNRPSNLRSLSTGFATLGSKGLTSGLRSCRGTSSGSHVPPTPMKSNQLRGRTIRLRTSNELLKEKEIRFNIKQTKQTSASILNEPPDPNKIYFINEGLIGCGSFGLVYKVKRRKTNKYYALKICLNRISSKIKSNNSGSENDKVDEYLKQVRICEKLKKGKKPINPNICLFRIFFIKNQILYQVFELCQYGNLKQFLNDKAGNKLNTLQIYNIFVQILNALCYIHSLEIVHCDLKPENIFIFRKDDVCHGSYLLKIGDFGIATDISLSISKSQQTIKLMSGDPIYIAPELLHTFNGKYKICPNLKKIDVFSFGIILIELIANVRLSGQGKLFQDLRNIDNETICLNWDWFNIENEKEIEQENDDDDDEYNEYNEIIDELKLKVSEMLHKEPSKRIGSGKLFKFCTKINLKYKNVALLSLKAFNSLKIPSQTDKCISQQFYGEIFEKVYVFNKNANEKDNNASFIICDDNKENKDDDNDNDNNDKDFESKYFKSTKLEQPAKELNTAFIL